MAEMRVVNGRVRCVVAIDVGFGRLTVSTAEEVEPSGAAATFVDWMSRM